MNHTDGSSIGRILASTWQHKRNAYASPAFWAALAVWLLAPPGLYAWNEWRILRRTVVAIPAADRMLVGAMHHTSLVTGMTLTAFWLVLAWFVVVSNVLQQNQPALARLVPGHVARLRVALLAAWGGIILLVAAAAGFLLDAALAWACSVAAAMMLIAIAVRWPATWLVAIGAPMALTTLLVGHDDAGFAGALAGAWRQEPWLVTAIVVTAGALSLVAIVSEQGHGSRSLYETGRAFGRRFARPSQAGCATHSGGLARPYAWWMARLLARRDSSVESRLLLGFGPTVHWTTRIRDIGRFVAVGGGICTLVVALAAFFGRELRDLFPWLAFGLLTGACTPALQAAARLYQTRREQALLVLLPGVPRGAPLNRWLAWQMSVLFGVSALGGFVLAGALDAFCETLAPGVVEHTVGGMTAAIAVALLPQVAWQWRTWARLGGAPGQEFLPSLAPFLLGGVALALHAWAGLGYVGMGIAFAVAAAAYCAWRWWRMGGEPTALPIGRLAR